MRSLALAFSSSRRAPPKTASWRPSAMARNRVGVCSRLRVAPGDVSSTVRPASMSSCTRATTRRTPSAAAWRSRNSSTSSKLRPVSTWRTGKGTGAGQKALRARCSMTMESLPPENSSVGRSNSAATSRKTWIDWASSARRCDRR